MASAITIATSWREIEHAEIKEAAGGVFNMESLLAPMSDE
jgi:hypothetical protein